MSQSLSAIEHLDFFPEPPCELLWGNATIRVISRCHRGKAVAYVKYRANNGVVYGGYICRTCLDLANRAGRIVELVTTL